MKIRYYNDTLYYLPSEKIVDNDLIVTVKQENLIFDLRKMFNYPIQFVMKYNPNRRQIPYNKRNAEKLLADIGKDYMMEINLHIKYENEKESLKLARKLKKLADNKHVKLYIKWEKIS